MRVYTPTSCVISQAPIALRDGSTVVICSRIDLEEAQRDRALKAAKSSKAKSQGGLKGRLAGGRSSASSSLSSRSGRTREASLVIGRPQAKAEKEMEKDSGHTPEQVLASEFKVPLEQAKFALEAAGGDLAVARGFLCS